MFETVSFAITEQNNEGNRESVGAQHHVKLHEKTMRETMFELHEGRITAAAEPSN